MVWFSHGTLGRLLRVQSASYGAGASAHFGTSVQLRSAHAAPEGNPFDTE
jgi:hypothetical protein